MSSAGTTTTKLISLATRLRRLRFTRFWIAILATISVAGTVPPWCSRKTYAGRLLVVVLAEALDGRDYVVTARAMTATEQDTFRRSTQNDY